ncbi:hypothetical protein PFISCL1PPCAC_25177, partial [Pristionchus fissidentatus]
SFFDVCPYGRQTIGECLYGLCPAGAKCLNNHCCIPSPKLSSRRRQQPIVDANLIKDIEKIRKKKGGACFENGNYPIGVCLGDNLCPVGYTCENDSCCNVAEGIRIRSRRKKKLVSEEEWTEDEDLIDRGVEEEEEDDNGDDEEALGSREEEKESEEEERARLTSEEERENEEE